MPTFRAAVDLSWTVASGSPGVNVFHGRAVTTSGPANDVSLLMDIVRQFFFEIRGLYCTDVTMRWNGEAHGVGDDIGNVYNGTPWTVTGSGGTDHLAPALAMLVKWASDSGGRSGRGRTFIGPLQDAVSETNGTPDDGVRTQLLTAAENLIESSDSFGNGALGVYSRVEDVFRDFTSSSVPNYFAVIRSRRD